MITDRSDEVAVMQCRLRELKGLRVLRSSPSGHGLDATVFAVRVVTVAD